MPKRRAEIEIEPEHKTHRKLMTSAIAAASMTRVHVETLCEIEHKPLLSTHRDVIIKCTALMGKYREQVDSADDPSGLIRYLYMAHHGETTGSYSPHLHHWCQNWSIVFGRAARVLAWHAAFNWYKHQDEIVRLLMAPVSSSTMQELMTLLGVELDVVPDVFEVFPKMVDCLKVLDPTLSCERFCEVEVESEGKRLMRWRDKTWGLDPKIKDPEIVSECLDVDQLIEDIAKRPDLCETINLALRDLSAYPELYDWVRPKYTLSWMELMDELSHPSWKFAPLLLRLQVLQRAAHSMRRACCKTIKQRRHRKPENRASQCAADMRSRMTNVILPDGSHTKMLSYPGADSDLVAEAGWPQLKKWERTFLLTRRGDTVRITKRQ